MHLKTADIYVITIFWLYVHYKYTVKSCRYTVRVQCYMCDWMDEQI